MANPKGGNARSMGKKSTTGGRKKTAAKTTRTTARKTATPTARKTKAPARGRGASAA